MLGLVSVDGKDEDLTSLPTQEITGQRFSSHMASISGTESDEFLTTTYCIIITESADHYNEIPMLLGQEMRLSCFYDRTIHGQKIHPPPVMDGNVMWLQLDKPLRSNDKG